MSLRIGLIGCGSLGSQVHVPNLRSLRGVQLVACADQDAARRAALGAAARDRARVRTVGLMKSDGIPGL